ncbi:hypothetical protein ATK74_1775 [Propionicimonas paludicola]|uniref:Ead/Ea22-like protein n=1 Tax=Propionicimonas paludicola TaxID=185243 RepID=A0A2A9CU89_9ACTN|nr:hypothetical protein [Propionicimonas paludicola]PFG17212.1 hypothetical protein ATK74_1775 [Propionicimonas paludicola]
MPEPITDDQRDLVSEVREALAKATPGPWEASASDSGHSKFEMNHYVLAGPVGDTVCDMESHVRVSINEQVAKDEGVADAYLIAHAPEWLAALCDEVERLSDLASERRSEVVRATQEAHEWESEAEDANARAEEAEAAVERVRALAAGLARQGTLPIYASASEIGGWFLAALDGE